MLSRGGQNVPILLNEAFGIVVAELLSRDDKHGLLVIRPKQPNLLGHALVGLCGQGGGGGEREGGKQIGMRLARCGLDVRCDIHIP